MTLHFVHVGKTGGTAIKRALRSKGLAYWDGDTEEFVAGVPETPYGRIQLHRHSFRITHVPEGDHVFFCLRDPVSRFLSAFYSRANKGQPRFYFEWTPEERRAFEAFPTPQRLAAGLASSDGEERGLARWAMRHIRHMRPMHRVVGTPRQIRARGRQIVYIAMQETLADDWRQLRALLDLPQRARLPSGPVRSHRGDASLDSHLDPASVAALRDWYRSDYELLSYCHALRKRRGWGAGETPDPGTERFRRIASVRAALTPAAVPPDGVVARGRS